MTNAEIRRALIGCLTSDRATSVVLAAMTALEGRADSDVEVREAFTRVLENDEISSSARVRAGASLFPTADAALSARVADAMEEVVLKARRRGGNRDVVEQALSVLERVDRERAERLRTRPRAGVLGSATAMYPSPAL